MSESSMPTKLSYNRDQVAESVAEELLAEHSNVVVVIDEIKRAVNEKAPYWNKANPSEEPIEGQDLLLKMVLGVLHPDELEEGTRIKRHKIRMQACLPVPNPNYPDHKLPDWVSNMWTNFLRAFMPDDHLKVTRQNGKLYVGDEEIEAEDLGNVKIELADKRFDEACKLWENPEALLGKAAYATIKHSVMDDGSVFLNANNLRSELGKSKTGQPHRLTPYEDLIVKVGVDGGTKKKSGGSKKKATKKKVAKKRPSGRRRAS